jgi:sugar phosphate isomerase/epimerase
MRTTRRSILGAGVATVSAVGAARFDASGGPGSLGLVIHSFPVRSAGDRGRKSQDRFSEPARFLDYARSLGTRGVQVSLGSLDETAADALRERALAASMYLEGIVAMPRDQADMGRFEAEIRMSKRAGAEVVRTVMLSGRRYETFTTAAAFRRFAEASSHALGLAALVVARLDVLLAVENHKDWRADELLALLKRVGNDHVGVCLDIGNSIALLEDPMEVVEALAPRAFTTHFKDMGVEEYRQGFLLAEVPLGAGILDLARAVRVVRAARPNIRLNLEMITRDPLKVPCLTEGYWVTLADLPGRHLAHTLALVREHPPSRALPRVSALPPAAQLRAEDDNIRHCLVFARDRLGL